MVISCCAVGCSNRQGYKANVAFYRIPADEDKRRLWLAAINRKEWQPSKYTRICSEHFLQGQKSDNPLSPNYVPSVFAHIKSPAKRRALGSLKKYEARQAMKKKKREESSRHEAARSLLNLSAEVSGSVFVADGEETEKEPANNDIIDNSKCDAMCQTELTSENIRSLQFECQQLRDKTFALQEKLNSDILEQSQSFLSGLHTKDGTNLKYIDLLGDESFILPPGMEHYSTNGDHLPLPPGRRRVLDQLFYGEHWEPDPYQGYERDPLSTLPLQARMQAHIHKHRLMAKHVGWDVAAVLSMNREGFGPKGPVEVQSELFIQHSSRGQYWDVSRIFQTRIVHPDVANSQGHTALIAATVNCHDDVIHLLLDMGADINKLNSEGMSALAVCQVLLYPSLHTILTKPPVMMSPSLSEINSVLSELDLTSLTPVLNNDTEKIKLEEVDEQAEDGEARRDQDAADVEHSIQNKDEDLTQKKSADSTSLLSSFNATKNFLQCSSEVLNHTGFPLSCDTQETVCRVPAMNIERNMRLKTLKVLLERGADPNLARVPLPVLFLAIMAGDTEVVKTLLLFGAHTDVPLPPEYKGLYPLHVAAALPGPQGPVITEILIQSLPDLDLDLQACDEDEIYEPDRISMMALKLRSSRDSPGLGKGGRTALHVACQREFDYMNASKVVSILLSHRASTNLLWSGHSPLSLAVASGNHLAVQELLNGGADPNTPLGPTVGSALCALININYNFGENKMKILDMLSNADADIFMPVKVDGVEGTVFDYAHSILKENFDLDHTQAHTFGGKERKVLEARQLQNAMVNLLRHKCKGMGAEDLTPESQESAETSRLPGFCFFCGCSISKKLTACTQDHKVFCSRTCKNKDKVVHVPANMKENYSFN